MVCVVGRNGITPPLPAIASAVHSAVGARVRHLPITPEKVLKAVNSTGS